MTRRRKPKGAPALVGEPLAKKPRKCGKCGRTGHRADNCPENDLGSRPAYAKTRVLTVEPPPLAEDRTPPGAAVDSDPDGPEPKAAPERTAGSPSESGPSEVTGEEWGSESTAATTAEQKLALEAVLTVAFGTWSAALLQSGAFGPDPDRGLRSAREKIDALSAKLCAEVAVAFGWVADSKWLTLMGAAGVVGVNYGLPTYQVIKAQRDRDNAGPGLASGK